MTAKKWTLAECRNEHEYIRFVDSAELRRAFNNDKMCFAEYCNMQANHVEASGYPLIAEDIRNQRDTWYPTFRSDKRAVGWEIIGTSAFPPNCTPSGIA